MPLVLLAGGAIVAVGLFHADGVLSFDSLLDSRAALRAHVAQHRVLTAAAFVATYVAVAALSVPGGFILTLTGGFLFGTVPGAIAAAAAATGGATLLFLAARGILADFVRRRTSRIMERIRHEVSRSAWSVMLCLRLSPVIPFWLVNVAAAGAGVGLRTFVWTTALGILPVTFTIAFAGDNLETLAATAQAARDVCRTAGDASCRATLPLGAVLSPVIVTLLVAASLLALLPALLRARAAQRLLE